MREKKLFIIIIGLCLVLVLAALPLMACGQAKPEQAIELSLSTWTGPEHYVTNALNHWAATVEEATNGQLKIVLYPGGVLAKGPQCYDACIKGIADLCNNADGYTPGRFPVSRGINLPLGISWSVQATMVYNDFIDKFNPAEWRDTHVMYHYAMGYAFFFSTKPVTNLADLKGQRIRCMGSDVPVVQACGATPVAMPMSEAYVALQKNIVDGVLTNYGAAMDWKFGELVNYAWELPIRCAGFYLTMNEDVWNGLPPDIQQTLNEVNPVEAIETAKFCGWDRLEVPGKEWCVGQGVQVTVPTAQEKAEYVATVGKQLQEEYVAEMNGMGHPGQEYVDYLIERVEVHKDQNDAG